MSPNGRDGDGRDGDGRAFGGRFLLGVNYWSRGGGPRMWERFDAALAARELEQMRAIGLDACRLFAFVPSLMPSPPSVDPAVVERMRAFGQLAKQAGVALLPTALVGHMSGENYDFPGQRGRSLYTEPELLDWQVRVVEALAGALGDAEVAAWVLSNEMPLWAPPRGHDAGEIRAWAERLIGALRAADPARRPVGTGDGAMGGWPTRALAPLVDYLAPHVYFSDLDPLRQAFAVDFAARALQPLGLPILLEELGCSTTQAGEPEQAAYYREAILAALGIGCSGALGWCWSDFDPETLGLETPYSHHAFELGFGITRSDGSEKPVCDELRALRTLLDTTGAGRARAVRPRVALLRPSYHETEYPFSWEDRELGRRTLLQAYVLACQAGLDPDLIGEDDLDASLAGYQLVLCPSTQKLRTPTWLRLRDAARAGATVYWSYLSGDYAFHQGAWLPPSFPELTGLRHRLRYGCFDLPPERVQLKGPVPLSVPTGVAHASSPFQLARLPIELAGARALAFDGEGRPALTAHALGRGQVIFLAYPWERYLTLLPDGSARDGHRLYRLLADEAHLELRYPTRHPDVQSRVLEAGPDDLVLVQHRGWTAHVDDATELPRQAEIVWERAAPPGAFGPKGARLYRVPNVRSRFG